MDSPKVILIGNSASGKTTTCYKLNGVPVKYIDPARPLDRQSLNGVIVPTIGVEVHPHRAPSGTTYNLWDKAGKEKLGRRGDGHYIGAKIALIFHGGEEYRTPQQWEGDVRRVAPNAQVYHIGGSFEEKRAKVCEILA